jgi:hypothetical protein
VDPTLLVALGSLAAAQTHGTAATAEAAVQLLNYCATHPDACLRYHASGMTLYLHSDASYLSESQARSRAGGHFFLSDAPVNPALPLPLPPPANGALHTTSTILRHVMASAAEAELGALFVNAQQAVILRTALCELGHPQPPTPIQADNATATGIANDTVRQRRSKTMDMRFYWLRDRIRQGHFHIYWRPGTSNLADYFTKHHPTAHHRLMRPLYLHAPGVHHLRGCVAPPSPLGTRNCGTKLPPAPNATSARPSTPDPDPGASNDRPPAPAQIVNSLKLNRHYSHPFKQDTNDCARNLGNVPRRRAT